MTPQQVRDPSRTHPLPARSTAGFTLMELLMVVVILMIMVGIAGVPTLGTAQQSLDLIEMELADAIKYAQAQALGTRSAHGVAFDVATERFAVIAADGTAVEHPLTHQQFVVRLFGPERAAPVDMVSASFGSTNAAIVFDGQGVPVAGGIVVLTCHGLSRSVAVDDATGWVSTL